MSYRDWAAALLILMLVWPAASPGAGGGEVEPGSDAARGPSPEEALTWGPGPDEPGSLPGPLLPPAHSRPLARSKELPRFGPGSLTFGPSSVNVGADGSWNDGSGPRPPGTDWNGGSSLSSRAVPHRGELPLDGLPPPPGPSRASSGPDTPPPASGDWTVDGTGNEVDNATLLLNGWLNVTTGDLTLDNATVILNCTQNGELGVHVFPGGTLNLTNVRITAFNGSLHYKFIVEGKMTMDRCNVSETWGIPNSWRRDAGISIQSTQVRMRSSTVHDGVTSAIQVLDDAEPQMSDLEIWNNSVFGIGIFNDSRPRVTNATCFNNEWGGISAFGTSQPFIENCTIFGSQNNGIQSLVSSGPTIRNCTVTMNHGSGISIGDTSNPQIVNCIATFNDYQGIQVSESANPKISDIVSDSNGCGLSTCGAATPDVSNITTFNSTTNGIQVADSSRPVILNWTAMNSQWSGLMMGMTARPQCTDCTITRSGWHGIQVFNLTRPTFTNCTFKDNAMCGIAIFGSETAVLTDCDFSGNDMYGLETGQSAHPMITNCTSSRNSLLEFGFFETSWPTVTGCTAVDCLSDGIVIADSARPVLAGCNVSNNFGNGIMLWGSPSPTIDGCTVAGNRQCGISISNDSKPSISGCLILDNAVGGISVLDSAHPIISRCTLMRNGDCGFDLDHDSTAELRDCTVSGSLMRGIHVTGSARPTIENCTARDNAWGILVQDSAAPSLKNVTSSENEGGGILINGTSAPVLVDCQFFENGQTGVWMIDKPGPTMSGLYLSGNRGQNLWMSADSPVLLANSTLTGDCSHDLQLSNRSRLTLLNTTYTKPALITGDAQLTVQWYLSFVVLDRANRPVPGAAVEGRGQNGSSISPKVTGKDGTVMNLVATERVQREMGSQNELVQCGPYDLIVSKDGTTNRTPDFPASRSISWRLYFDHPPRLDFLPDMVVTEDQPSELDLGSHVLDPDDSPSGLVFTTDRDYARINNDTRLLTINCPLNIDGDVVTVTVSDGLKNSNQTLNLSIITVNDPPLCRAPIPDLSVTEDDTLLVDLLYHFWDEESGERLTFTCNREEILIDRELRKASWTPGEGNASLEGVTFTACDGYLLTTSNEFDVAFVAVNEPPVYRGGLEGTAVYEHESWTADLDECFWDEEDDARLVFESSSPEVQVGTDHACRWRPAGNSSRSIELVFTAHDASNYTMTVSSDPITLTYIPVNDPPAYLGTPGNVRLKLGEEWNVTLEELFKDEDTEFLKFSVNNAAVKIVEISKSLHRAVWRPNEFSNDVSGVVLTAYDGRTYIRSPPIELKFDRPEKQEEPQKVTSLVGMLPWYVYILLPAGVIAGVAAFYAYRRVKYGRYEVQQVFLVYRDGRLIAHRSKKAGAAGSEDVISGMLTALQGFIKESLQDENQGELDEMKYGDLKIAIERGEKVYLAVFLSGYITDALKASMKKVMGEVDSKFGAVLQSWDGTLRKLRGIDGRIDELMAREEPSRSAGPEGAPPPTAAPAGTKKLLQKVISQMAPAPGEEVSLKSELEFFQGYIRLKVAVKNGLDTLISSASFKLVHDLVALRLDRVEPEFELKGDEVLLGNIEPREKKTVAFYLDPRICLETFLEGVLTYKDASGALQTQKLPRKLAAVVCPVFYTDENINTAMLKKMCSEELDKKDGRLFRLPGGLDPRKAFDVASAVVKHHDVRLVRQFVEKEPYRAEGWYFGKAKGRDDRMVIRVRVLGEKGVLEFFGSSTSMLMLTGLLAELRGDLADELRLGKVEGEAVQVTDDAALKELSSERTLLDGAPEGSGKGAPGGRDGESPPGTG